MAQHGDNHKGWPKGKKRPKEFGVAVSNRTKGVKLSEEHKKALSVSRLGKKRPPMTDEQKAKISISLTGRKLSEAHKQSLRGKRNPLSDEHKAKISKANKGKREGAKFPDEWKKRMSEAQHCRPPITEEQRAVLVDAQRKNWAKGEHRERHKEAVRKSSLTRKFSAKNGRGKGGRVNGVWLRSSWEIAFANRLNEIGLLWEYEKVRFALSDGRVYIPDFLISFSGLLIEVKGWWSPKALAKFAMFKAEFPAVMIEVVDTMEKIQNWKLEK